MARGFVELTEESFHKLDDFLSSGGGGGGGGGTIPDGGITTPKLADGAVTFPKLSQDVVDLLDNKADIDGYYSQLTAGLAENLIGRGDAVPAEYLYRTAGGTADIEDGIATIDCIKGNTLVWNQMYDHTKRSTITSNGVTVTNNNDGSFTVSGTATDTTTIQWHQSANYTFKVGHKYLLTGMCPAGGSMDTYRATDAWSSTFITTNGTAMVSVTTNDKTVQLRIRIESGVTINGVCRPQIFDLTLMFGAGNEPATVEEFEAMFPLPYYPYSEPKLLPVDMRGIETVGFNLLDIERSEVINTRAKGGAYENTAMRDLSENQVWVGITMNNYFNPNNITSYNIGNESVSVSTVQTGYGLGFPVKVFPNTEYHVDCGAESDANAVFAICAYTEDGAYIQYLPINAPGTSKSITFTTPSNCRWAMVILRPIANTVANAVHPVLNLSWSGYRNGEYEEHWSAERPIDTSRFFPTGMKKVGDKADALYADRADMKVGVYTFTGSERVYLEDWRHVDGYYAFSIGYANIPNFTVASNNIRMVELDTLSYEVVFSGTAGISVAPPATPQLYGIFVRVPTSIASNAAQLLAWLAGKQLYYELATPTTTPIDPPLNLSYKVSDFGTERIMVDETADAPQTAPVPMEVEYGISAIDTIRRLPKEYQSHKSMGQLTAALESSLGVDITETWDETEQRYEYEIGSLEIGTDNIEDGAVTDAKLAPINIQPDFIPTLPYKVTRTRTGYECEYPDLTDFINIYVDPADGDDNNTGLEGYPVKTLARGLYRSQKQMYNNSRKVVLNLADDSVFYIDDLPTSWSVTKSFVLRADNSATLITGKKPEFTASGNHYVSEALTAYAPIGCVDMSGTDDYGIFKTMNVVSSEDEVESTDNSYYIDTTNKVVYVNPSSQISDIVVVFSNTYACNLAGTSINESAVIMAENIRFVGNSTATGRAASTVGETLVRTFYAKNCIFEHGFTNNVVSFNDFDYTYIVDCVSGFAKLDCFNYHFTRKPTPTNALVVEVNCKAKESGYYNTADSSDNLTTCHDGANILRCGCHGYNGNGPLCADVNGCCSACVDCTYVNTSYTDKPAGVNKAAFLFDDAQTTRKGKSLLQNCFGYDSRNNRLVSAVDLILNGINAGGSITATTVSVGKDPL